MMNFTRRHRHHYLDRLAADPLFLGVPRHHMPIVGRGVDVLVLDSGRDIRCDPARESIIVTTGYALMIDGEHRPVAVLGPGAVIGAADRDHTGVSERMLAITELRGYVIARREIPALMAIAPRLAAALARPPTTFVVAERPVAPAEPARM